MCHRDDIALAAHILDDDACKTIVFTCHKLILLLAFFKCLFRQLKTQPAILQTDCRNKGQCRQLLRVGKALVLEGHGDPAAPACGGGNVRLPAHQRIDRSQQVLLSFVFLHRRKLSFRNRHRMILRLYIHATLARRGRIYQKQKSPKTSGHSNAAPALPAGQRRFVLDDPGDAPQAECG